MSSAAITPTELSAWRAGTDVAGWTHMNAAGASPTSQECHEAMTAHMELERAVGGYAAAAQREHGMHGSMAALLGCDADEIALAESAQRAWSMPFLRLKPSPRASAARDALEPRLGADLAWGSLQLRAGDRILCWSSEYAGNAVAMLQAVKQTGAALTVLPMRPDGIVDVEALRSALDAPEAAEGRCVVALTHIQTDSSVVQPAAEVGALARAAGALYMLDACQSVGALPVDVRALQCDFACGTGRKWLRGPRGTGFLYARRAAMDHPLVGEPSQIDHTSVRWAARDAYELAPGAARYEFWEKSVAGAAGLAVAAEQCRAVGPERIAARSAALAARLRRGLAALPGVALRDAPAGFDEAAAAARGAARCAIVCFEAESARGAAVGARRVVAALAARKVGASGSPPTHTFEDALWARPVAVRLSPSYFNTEDEVDRVVGVVREVLDELEGGGGGA